MVQSSHRSGPHAMAYLNEKVAFRQMQPNPSILENHGMKLAAANFGGIAAIRPTVTWRCLGQTQQRSVGCIILRYSFSYRVCTFG